MRASQYVAKKAAQGEIFFECADRGGGIHRVTDPTGWAVELNCPQNFTMPGCDDDDAAAAAVAAADFGWCTGGVCAGEPPEGDDDGGAVVFERRP